MYWIPSSAMVQQTRSSSLVKLTNNGHYKYINTCMWQNQDCVNCSVLCSVLRSILHSVLRSVLHPVLCSVLRSVLLSVQHLRFMIQYCYSASTLRLALYYVHTTTTVWERFIDAYCMLKVYTWSRSSMQQQPRTATNTTKTLLHSEIATTPEPATTGWWKCCRPEAEIPAQAWQTSNH